MKHRLFVHQLLSGFVGVVFLGSSALVSAGSSIRLDELAGKTHLHGIAADPIESDQFYLATHHGFFRVTNGGDATRISTNQNDYMGFTAHPTNSSIFYASGHPERGGNTGFIESTDGGKNWRQLSAGVGGPVDFHQMDVSQIDPQVIYGVYKGLQKSSDGGKTWVRKSNVPPKLIDFASSASNLGTLYAATQNGLLVSSDDGETWNAAHFNKATATMVQAASDGSIYAFVVGLGLLRSTDDSLEWQVLNNKFGENYFLHLAVNPTNTRTLYSITSDAKILTSHDGGANWSAIE